MILKNTKLITILVFTLFSALIRGNFLNNKKTYIYIEIFDVGQGDSISINYKNKKILIDGGDNYELDKYILKSSIFPFCKVDYIFISHAHSDHLRGIDKLIKWCDIGKVFYSFMEYESSLVEKFKNLIYKKKIKTEILRMGDTFEIGELKIYVLWPEQKNKKMFKDNLNNSSLILLLDLGKFEGLFLGDAEIEALHSVYTINHELLNYVIQDGLDILKISHHGSKTGVYKPLFSLIKPKYCAISVGRDNKFSHPHDEALSYFGSIGCNVLRTDKVGSIIFKVDMNGVNMPVSTN